MRLFYALYAPAYMMFWSVIDFTEYMIILVEIGWKYNTYIDDIDNDVLNEEIEKRLNE